ncbi:uncharacterized protein TNCT_275001 [Trichonephila clavata]|uniref:Uncharacterized protein n=1 Tax=Trichonephila clavata TaxID=2740835 RepID=A0A8X6HJB1_TRICU|nr:uncharacterized protein TNCT_275001 [Trichonephila clavata]
MKEMLSHWFRLCSEGLEKWMAIDKSEIEKWENPPVFTAAEMEPRLYRILVYSKCYALILLISCLMDTRLFKYINWYCITSLASAGGLILIFSPLLMWRVIPIVFFTIGLLFLAFITYNRYHYGVFYIYCIICCMEVPSFEFLLDIYVIVCFVVETVYSIYMKKALETFVPLIVLSECVIWFLPMDILYRVLINFFWLVIHSTFYSIIIPVLTLYFFMVAYILVMRNLGEDADVVYKIVHASLLENIEKYIFNASLVARP